MVEMQVPPSPAKRTKVPPTPAKRTMVPSNKVEDVRLEDGLLGGKSPQKCDGCDSDKLQVDLDNSQSGKYQFGGLYDDHSVYGC